MAGKTGATKPAASRIEALDQPRPAIERRRSYRQPLLTVGLLFEAGQPADQAKPIQVLVRDVSLHGVGFRASMAFQTDRIYYVHIGAGPLHLSSRMRIVSARARSDGTYDVGAEFV